MPPIKTFTASYTDSKYVEVASGDSDKKKSAKKTDLKVTDFIENKFKSTEDLPTYDHCGVTKVRRRSSVDNQNSLSSILDSLDFNNEKRNNSNVSTTVNSYYNSYDNSCNMTRSNSFSNIPTINGSRPALENTDFKDTDTILKNALMRQNLGLLLLKAQLCVYVYIFMCMRMYRNKHLYIHECMYM